MRSGIGATYQKTLEKQETQKRGKYYLFGVFFDGTGNDMTNNHSKKKNEETKVYGVGAVASVTSTQLSTAKQYNVFKQAKGSYQLSGEYDNGDGDDYSNVALLQACYIGLSQDRIQQLKQNKDVYVYNVYSEGPGTTGNTITKLNGTAFGTGESGVVSLLSKVTEEISQKLPFDLTDTEIHFHVFGFSRGATLARMFSTIVLGDKIPTGIQNSNSYINHILPLYNYLRNTNPKPTVSVDFIGLFDTVSSIGTDTGVNGSDTNNVVKYGLFLDPKVKAALHLCASDEFREHFALTDLGKSVNNQNITEVFIPGCHTDVGGTYKFGTRVMKIKHHEQMRNTPTGVPKPYNQYKMFVSNPHSAKSGVFKEINVETLKMLGWCSDNGDIKNKELIYEITRTIKQGYNLIPFNLMYKRANEATKEQVFANQPAISRFSIPTDLAECYNRISCRVNLVQNGRHFIYYGDNSNTYIYSWLRRNYIHYSADIGIIDGIGVDVSRKDDVLLCRRIVSGDSDSQGLKWMCDYE